MEPHSFLGPQSQGGWPCHSAVKCCQVDLLHLLLQICWNCVTLCYICWNNYRGLWVALSPNALRSVQFSCSLVADSLQPHEPQHTRPPCPSLTPGVYPNSCPSSWWCHTTISSSVVPFSSCPQPFPASGSFQMSQPFTSGGQSIGVSASTSVFPMNIQGWFPLGLSDLISCCLRDSQESTPAPQFESINFSALLLMVELLHLYMITRKTIAFTRWTFVSKVMSLLFNMLSRFVITFLQRRKYLLISWLQSLPFMDDCPSCSHPFMDHSLVMAKGLLWLEATSHAM